MSTKDEIFGYVMNSPENTNPAVLGSMLNGLEMPIATKDTLGVVKVGNNLSITRQGTLSYNGPTLPYPTDNYANLMCWNKQSRSWDTLPSYSFTWDSRNPYLSPTSSSSEINYFLNYIENTTDIGMICININTNTGSIQPDPKLDRILYFLVGTGATYIGDPYIGCEFVAKIPGQSSGFDFALCSFTLYKDQTEFPITVKRLLFDE